MGTLRTVLAAADLMVADGKGGRICLVSSAAGLVSTPGYGMYSATKFAHRGCVRACERPCVRACVRTYVCTRNTWRVRAAAFAFLVGALASCDVIAKHSCVCCPPLCQVCGGRVRRAAPPRSPALCVLPWEHQGA